MYVVYFSTRYIHQPWKCPSGILARAGVKLGETYPARIVDNLEECREQVMNQSSFRISRQRGNREINKVSNGWLGYLC